MRLSARFTKVSTTHEGLHTLGPGAVHYGRRRTAGSRYSMLMARLTDLQEVNGTKIDKVIALKFPAYFAPHSHKVCWILHQHRQAYDFYGTELSDLWQSNEGKAVAAEIKRWDDYFLPQSAGLYTISNTVTDRLLRFNGIKAQTLYPPPLNHNNFRGFALPFTGKGPRSNFRGGKDRPLCQLPGRVQRGLR